MTSKKTSPILTSTFDSLNCKLPPLKEKLPKTKRRSLYSLSDKKERLNLIKMRMAKDKKDDFNFPSRKRNVTYPLTSLECLSESMQNLNLKQTNIKHLLKPDSDWGTRLHDPKKLPFQNFIPGIIMDLETCYTNDIGFQINKMKSYIQQIGACGIGIDIEDFDVACLLPDKFVKKNTLIPEVKTEDDFISVLNMLEQQPELSISGYKKVIGRPKISTEDFLIIYNTSLTFWKENSIDWQEKDSIKIIKTWREKYKLKHPYPLLFRCEDALKLFANYTKQCPVWYAHNGHGFDYIIMEKWFRIYNIPMSCVCDAYAPRTTTSMQYLRNRPKGPNYSIYDIHGNQIGKSPWKVNGQKIICFDTMKLIKSDKRSMLKKGGKRVSQQGLKKKEFISTGIDSKEEKLYYYWNDGSKTTSLYSHKQQDLLEAVGIKSNDSSAHTALYDCLTLRELIYRAFDNSFILKKKLRDVGFE